MSYLYLGPVSGNKKRILGLTAEKPWADNLLIMHKLQSNNTLDDVSHKPVSSSDELSDVASDDWTPSLNKSAIPEEASASTSERGRQLLGSSPRPQLEVDKSNIPSTSFISGGRRSGLSSGQSFKRPFQAMNDGAADEDERTELWGSKKPRMRKLYGQSRGNDSIRGSQAVIQDQKTKKTNGAGKKKLKAQVNGGLLLQCKSGGSHGGAKLTCSFFLIHSRWRAKHW